MPKTIEEAMEERRQQHNTPIEEMEEYKEIMANAHNRMVMGLHHMNVVRLESLPLEFAEKCYEALTSDDTSRRRLEHNKDIDLLTVWLNVGEGWFPFVVATGRELRGLGSYTDTEEPAHHTMS